MFCARCGSQLEAGASFCSNCGAAVGGLGPGPPAPAVVGARPARLSTGILALLSVLALVVGGAAGLALGYFGDLSGEEPTSGSLSSLVSGGTSNGAGTTLAITTTGTTTDSGTVSSTAQGPGGAGWYTSSSEVTTTSRSTTSTSRPTTTARAVRFYEGWPWDEPGYTVILTAVNGPPGGDPNEPAYQLAHCILADRLFDVGVLYSSDYRCIEHRPDGGTHEIQPGFFVVFSGVYHDFEKAKKHVDEVAAALERVDWYQGWLPWWGWVVVVLEVIPFS